jgi:hypothetical protein
LLAWERQGWVRHRRLARGRVVLGWAREQKSKEIPYTSKNKQKLQPWVTEHSAQQMHNKKRSRQFKMHNKKRSRQISSLNERQPRKGLFGKPLNNQAWPHFADARNFYKILCLTLEIIRGIRHI